jgi:hypothetical protein
MTTVDALEPVDFGSAMGKGCEDQEARHEPESSGRQGVYGLERGEVL